MKTWKTRILSAFLVIMTLLTLLPTSALAATSTGTGIKPTTDPNLWSTRLTSTGQQYSYRPPMAYFIFSHYTSNGCKAKKSKKYLIAKTRLRRGISPLSLYIFSQLFLIPFFFVITKLIFQILKALTNTCFNMHILFSNQSYSISSSTVLYCYNHMHRTLTNPKLFCCLSHCRIIFYNIICNFHCTLLNIFSHRKAPA